MTGALPAEVRELMGAVLAAIDIPYPATLGDATLHRELLAERVMHATITLRHVLAREGTRFPADLPWETAYLREQLTAHPATSPGPGLGPRSRPPPRTPGVGMADDAADRPVLRPPDRLGRAPLPGPGAGWSGRPPALLRLPVLGGLDPGGPAPTAGR